MSTPFPKKYSELETLQDINCVWINKNKNNAILVIVYTQCEKMFTNLWNIGPFQYV